VKSVVQIGLQLIDRLKCLHEIGFLHMDLKPDNICIGSKNFSSTESSQIFLIDFGISKTYLDSDGKHIEFGPNLVF